MKIYLLSMWMGGFLVTPVSLAQCITDKGPYQDNGGLASFPFYNSCSYAVAISLCVKSSGGGGSLFNVYSGTVPAINTLTLTAGRWSTLSGYRWSENSRVTCPFF